MRVAEIVDGRVRRITVTNTADTGADFLMASLGGVWVDVPEDMACGFDYSWDAENGWFVPWKPFDSWVLDTETLTWVAPIPYPEDGNEYTWDEETTDWVEVVDEAV